MTAKTFLSLILYTAVALLATTFCTAAEPDKDGWTKYYVDRMGVDYFYDKDHVEYPSKGLIKVIRKRIFPKGSQQKEIISIDEMNCGTLKHRSLGLTTVAFDGDSKTTNLNSEWAYVWGNTPEEWITDKLCPETKK